MSDIIVTWGQSWQGNVAVTLGTAVEPLTGDDVVWIAKLNPNDADDDAVIDKRLSEGTIAPVSLAGGTVQLQLNPADYTALDSGQDTPLSYGLYLTTSGGSRYELASGELVVTASSWGGG